MNVDTIKVKYFKDNKSIFLFKGIFFIPKNNISNNVKIFLFLFLFFLLFLTKNYRSEVPRSADPQFSNTQDMERVMTKISATFSILSAAKSSESRREKKAAPKP